jgi:hypothetical protein
MQFIPALCKMNFQVVCTPPPAKALVHMQHGYKGYNTPHQSKTSEEQTSKLKTGAYLHGISGSWLQIKCPLNITSHWLTLHLQHSRLAGHWMPMQKRKRKIYT